MIGDNPVPNFNWILQYNIGHHHGTACSEPPCPVTQTDLLSTQSAKVQVHEIRLDLITLCFFVFS